MPVMIFYKDKTIPAQAATDVMQALGDTTKAVLNNPIEVRVVEPVLSYNANKIHIEMRFRDFMEWDDALLQTYHDKVMVVIGEVLTKHKVSCQYSFYIVPSMPPRPASRYTI